MFGMMEMKNNINLLEKELTLKAGIANLALLKENLEYNYVT